MRSMFDNAGSAWLPKGEPFNGTALQPWRLSTTVRLAVICAIVAISAGCGYDGSYRYPCQDPQNWSLEECQPPICEADGTCTKYLVPEGVLDETEG